jgi:hypothetical protein
MSRAAAAKTTKPEETGSRAQSRLRSGGQSRTRGGLSRSNMWTVSTKRTCLA